MTAAKKKPPLRKRKRSASPNAASAAATRLDPEAPTGHRAQFRSVTEMQRLELARRMGITPLEFLMSLMRDDAEDMETRVEAARAAAPYMHRKMPIAIETSEQRGITLDAGALRALSKQELNTLRTLLEKAGLASDKEQPAHAHLRLVRGSHEITDVAVEPEK